MFVILTYPKYRLSELISSYRLAEIEDIVTYEWERWRVCIRITKMIYLRCFVTATSR